MIKLYTTQLEEYDRMNSNYVMTVIAFVGGVLAIVGSLFEKKQSFDSEIFYVITSILILIIPCVGTLYFYVLSMNCRRVALYRGCLRVLEDRLRKITNLTVVDYNSKIDEGIMGKYFVNTSGPIIMTIFLIIIYCVSYYAALYNVARCENHSLEMWILYLSVTVVSFVASIIFACGAFTNKKARRDVARVLNNLWNSAP